MAFHKGQSGNPNGRPRGAKSAVTAIRRELIGEEDVRAIVDIVVAKALEGDLTAAAMILDRSIPKMRITAEITAPLESLAADMKAARERVAAGRNEGFATKYAHAREEPTGEGFKPSHFSTVDTVKAPVSRQIRGNSNPAPARLDMSGANDDPPGATDAVYNPM